MDEPFASLDAQTRTILQNELIQIWERFQTTIIFITHNIEEAIILGSKIAVMGKQPGTIKRILNNNLDRPRFVGHPGFDDMWQQLHASLNLTVITFEKESLKIDSRFNGCLFLSLSWCPEHDRNPY